LEAKIQTFYYSTKQSIQKLALWDTSSNTTGRFFIPPVVFINSSIVLPNNIVLFD